MAVDIYSSAVLNRVVQDLKNETRAPFLLDTFFAESSVSTKGEEIYFDTMVGKPRLAPFVSPLVEGQVVESLGYNTNSFRPAYVKDKRVMEDGKPIRRPAGAPILGPLDGMALRQIAVAAESDDQLGMLMRRQEWMAASALMTGSVTVTGEKYPTTVVNFGRDPSLSVVLTGSARWNDSAPAPLDNLETWSGLIRDASGANSIQTVMSQGTWSSFRKNADVKDLLSKLGNLSPETNIDVGPSAQTLGATHKGMVGSFDVWVYTDIYTAADGTTQKFLPDGYLLMAGPQLEGVRHYGQIKDEQAGFQPLDYFSKSWTVPDPSVRYLLLQSAPLPVPYRINASLCAKVY